MMMAAVEAVYKVAGLAHDITIDGNFKTITTQGKAAVEIGDFDDGAAYVTLRILITRRRLNYGDKVNHIT